jgi:hypothetical protein
VGAPGQRQRPPAGNGRNQLVNTAYRLRFVPGSGSTHLRLDCSAAGHETDSEAVLRRVRRLYVNRDNLRRGITRLVNATFAAFAGLKPAVRASRMPPTVA